MWGTFDSTAELILSLPHGCLAATFDISAAYRITPVRPNQQSSLCVFWDGMVHVDRAVMFGLSSSAGVFGSVADMLVAIYLAAGFGPLRKWVDDFFVVRLPQHSWTEQDFILLMAEIGVPWSLAKLRPLASVQRYIGFDWDLVSRSVSLPADKLSAIQQHLSAWLSDSSRFTANEAASLHGKLVHISCIFPLIRPFLRSLSYFTSSFISLKARRCPPPHVRADLGEVAFILIHAPRQVPLAAPQLIDLNWWGDASSSFGIGVTIGSFWAVWKWAPGFKVGPLQEFDIGWAEAVAVELGLQVALHCQLLSPGRYLVRSDNAGVVAVINKGHSRSARTNDVLRRIYCALVNAHISLEAIYVESRINITDALSRGDIAGFLRGFPQASDKISLPVPTHLISRLSQY